MKQQKKKKSFGKVIKKIFKKIIRNIVNLFVNLKNKFMSLPSKIRYVIYVWLGILIVILILVIGSNTTNNKIEEFRNSLEKGTEIVTVGGIHGKIVNVAETTFTIEIADGVKIKIEKAAVAIDESQIGKKKDEKVVSVDGNETK